jgi:uncharacterized protein with von Willebrand factor type A (vWA) domain
MAFLTPDPRHLDRQADRSPRSFDGLPGDARYRAWDGSQDLPDLTADELVDALADDLLEHGDLEEALRELMQRGLRGDQPGRGDLRGLRDLLSRLRDRREEVLRQGTLADPLADVRQELDEIVAQERAGVERRLDETEPGYEPPARDGAEGAPSAESGPAEPGGGAGRGDGSPPDPQLAQMLRRIAVRNLERLDELPPDVGGRFRALQDYEFLDPGARQRYEDLVERLRRSTLDRYTHGLADAVKGMRPEDLAGQRAMVRDLNDLLARRIAGDEPSQEDVDRFLAQHGGFFPGARTLDDVVEQLAQRMGAMQSLLQSMTPEQRAELEDAISALLRDDRLAVDLARLAAQLDMVLPGGLGQPQPFSGEGPLGLEQALAQLDRLAALDALEEQMDGTAGPGDLGSIDREQVRDLLGPEAERDLDVLDDLTRQLEEAGYLERRGQRLELTPRATRRIGQKVLDELFAKLRRDAFGGHRLDRSGHGGEREEVSKPLEFGDPFWLDLQATFGNALRRDENAPSRRPAGSPLRIRPEDFEVYRAEHSTSAATVLLVDLSRSMLLRGCYVAAKRVAIALDTLIRTQFPRDRLAVVGFAYSAHEIRPETLAELSYSEFEYGTNLQHGLHLARRILAQSRAANREVIVVTDGEPTAHTERDGRVEFSYPPTRRTIEMTLREVVRCTRDGITINTFMLDQSPSLTNFVGYITEINRGRAFYTEPDRLGEYVLVDFVRNRTGRVG